MSDNSKLLFVDLQTEGYDLHVGIWATHGNFKSFQDAYLYRADLNKWAEELRTFPHSPEHQVIFQYGHEDPKFYAELRLTAFVYEAPDNVALEVVMDNHGERPFQTRSEFSIPCRPPDIKDLGEMILDWDVGKNLMMEWTVPQGV